MNRSVVVNLIANVSSWNRGIASASKSLKDAANQNKQQVEAMSNQVGMLGAAMVAAAGVSVKKFMDFDAAMSAVKSSTRETTENMATLRAAALEAGAETVYSATESAKAIEELGKSGMSTADIVGGALSGSLSLAASEGMAVADAAEIMSSAMNQFSLKGDKASHVADLLAAGAGKAQGSAHELGMALNQSGLVANQFGMSIEDTTGTLAAFASAGLIGSDAGTSLRSMLLHLANPAKDTRELMDRLGISAYDASGKFIGMAGLADQLANATKNLTQQQRDQALAQIFGTDAIRGANILLKEGADGIRDWTAAVDEQGYAADAANARLDNLKGDLEALGGAFDTLLISMGEGSDGPLRSLVQGATEVLDVFNELPAPIKQTTTLLVGGGGLVLLGIAGMVKLSASISKTKVQMAELGLMTGKTSRAMAVLGKTSAVVAVGQVGTMLMTMSAQAQVGSTEVDKLASDLVSLSGGADAANGSLNKIFKNQQAISWLPWVKEVETAEDAAVSFANTAYEALATGFFQKIDRFFGGGSDMAKFEKQVEQLDGAFAAMVASGNADAAKTQYETFTKAAVENGVAIEDLVKYFPQYEAAIKGAVAETEAAAPPTKTHTELLEEQADAADGAWASIKGLADGMLGIRDAQVGYEAALDAANEAIKENGKTLDITTEKGRANRTALDDIAESGWALINQMREQGASEGELQDAMKRSRTDFVKTATQMGMNKQEAKALADELGLIPSSITTDVTIKQSGGSETYKYLQSIQDKIRAINGTKVRVAMGPGGQGGMTFSTGGGVSGPGTGTSDSIPAMLSNGEHVLTASDVEKAGGQHAIYRMRGMIQSGMLHFATGGAVGDKVAVDKRKVLNQRQSVKDAEKALAAAEKASTKASRAAADTSSKDKAKKQKAKEEARAAQDEVKEARKKVAQEKKRLAEAEKDLADSRKARDTENRRRSDIRGLRSEQETDVRRGTTVEQVTSGLSGGLNAVDAALRLANSGTLSPKKSAELRKAAQQAEKDLTQQYKILDETNKKIEEQSSLLSNVSNMRNQISQQMMGEVRLTDVLTSSTKQYSNARGDIWHSSGGSTTPAAIRDYLAKKLEKARTFNSKLDALRKKGAPAAMIQEVLAGGVEGGTMLATALLNASWGEWSEITNTWKALETEAGITGDIGTLSAFGTTSAAVERDLAKQTSLAEESKNILTTIANTLSGATTLSLQGYSEGGWITGGTPGKDSVPFVGMPGEFVVKAGPAAQNANFLEHINRGGSPKFVSTAGQYASIAGAPSRASLGTSGPVYVTIPDIYVHNPITGTDVRAVARQTVLAEISSAANAMAGGYV